MTDQAVDTSAGGGAGGRRRGRQFVGRRRELKELRADIERAGPGHPLGPQGARARVLLIAGRPRLRTHRARRRARPAARGAGLPRRGAARPAHRARRHARPHRAHRPRPARRARRAAPPGAAEDDLAEVAARGPRRPPGPAAARRRGRRRAGRPAAAGHPGLPGRRRPRGPADRHPRRPALHPRRPGHQVRAWSCWPGTPGRSASPSTRGPPRPSPRSAAASPPRSCWPAAGSRPGPRPPSPTWPSSCALPQDAERPGGTPAGPRLPARLRVPARRRRPDTAAARARPRRARRPAHRLRAGRLLGRRRPHRRWTTSSRSGLLRAVDCAALPQYEVPGCLAPAAAGPAEAPGRARPRSSWPGPGCWSGPYGCSSPAARSPRPTAPPARKKLAGLPRALRFPSPRAAADWLRVRRPALLASARLAVADGELDTLARRLMAALVRALAAHRGHRGRRPRAVRAPPAGPGRRRAARPAPREGRRAAEPRATWTPRRAGRGRRWPATGPALDAGREANDPYATGRAMESVGGAHQELGDWHRAADWFGRALAQRLARGERADAARLYGRIGTVHTYAGRYGEALRNWRAAVAGLPQGRRCRRPRAGVERAGPGPGVRGTRPRSRCAPARRPSSGRGAPRTSGCRPRCSCGSPTPWTGSATPRPPGCTAAPPSGCWGRAPGGSGPTERAGTDANACEIRSASAED